MGAKAAQLWNPRVGSTAQAVVQYEAQTGLMADIKKGEGGGAA